jgi:hypothetical protein
MRVSRRYRLGKKQPALDFVDVDPGGDTALFISPKAIQRLPSAWAHRCVYLIQSFFSAVLDQIRSGNDAEAQELLLSLREPNETHLGLSRGRSRGRAIGDASAHDIWTALSQSRAVTTGLLQDIEDTALLIPGIGLDIISDMTTNIIREPLIEYTQRQCGLNNIPMLPDVASGAIWNPTRGVWEERFVKLPVTKEGKLLLVPKVIVRRSLLYSLSDYYRNYLLTYLQQKEFSANTSLVRILKDGTRALPFKKDVEDKYGHTKEDVTRETIDAPHVLDEYREAKSNTPYHPLDHEQIAENEGDSPPDWDKMLNALLIVPTGNAHADSYEKAVEILLTALFYPDLVEPIRQYEIHGGRKRIDITFTNAATMGFFLWCSKHYPSSLIFVECKNYSGKIANPELDQISGRFSNSRGKVGLLVARNFDKKDLFAQRCIDTSKDDRGLILHLDDDDLVELVRIRKEMPDYHSWPLLKSKFLALIS